jgi:CRISPR-associated endonuclease/helicase Cas3
MISEKSADGNHTLSSGGRMDFEKEFKKITDFKPLNWQTRLYGEYLALGILPAAVDLPTGLGKTSIMAIWYLAFKSGANLPRRLVYVVDRRAVVDQATTVADKIKARSSDDRLRVSTLRGQHVDNREWLEDPAAPAIIVGTVDMIGSRLLFSGFGVSRKMRPYHAGLLGTDTLVVLDESHLVPPFERLLETIETDSAAFGPRDAKAHGTISPFKLLSLSATGRARKGTIFRLEEAKNDLNDEIVQSRLVAKKHLILEPVHNKKIEEVIAERAWALSSNGKEAVRILIYCDHRNTAKKVYEILKKKGVEIGLFVGARRVKERIDASEMLKKLGFLAGSEVKPEKPTFLVATSAGEVGIDLDSDHMVCDLVAWERMVQRFGRVNRLGKGNAKIFLAHSGEPKAKKPDAPNAEEIRAMIAWNCLHLFDNLTKDKDGIDVSPGALQKLKHHAKNDQKLQEKIEVATTPSPLYPALTRALLDAWSMTSLREHTGCPEVQPWLRGWIDDEPQTIVVWRKHLPSRSNVVESEVEAFFEAVPPHASEFLETETYRIVDWLIDRAHSLSCSKSIKEHDFASEEKINLKKKRLFYKDDVIGFVLSKSSEYKNKIIYSNIDIRENDDKTKSIKNLQRILNNRVLVLDARFSGLNEGLLSKDENEFPLTGDNEGWQIDADGVPITRFRIREYSIKENPAQDSHWRERFRFDIKRSADGETLRYLLIEKWRHEAATEEDRSSGNFQLLKDHQGWTEQKALALAKNLGLNEECTKLLACAARLHDEGKRASRWQRAFNAPREGGVYAKTKGPISYTLLDGYRHEFGSIPFAEKDAEFKTFSLKTQDLVLHLIASHHGFARPVIETRACDDAPPSALKQRAQNVAQRFVRLQDQWGPWGLAWWEALLRAADQQASRDNEMLQDNN